jgi:hypothetical protein
MTKSFDLDIRRVLALAYDRAWDKYYLHGRQTLDRKIVGLELAKRIVEVANEGERDERRLAAAGLHHLQTLTRAIGTAKTQKTPSQ